MRIMVEEVRYATHESAFVGSFKPYAHQLRTLELVREAIDKRQTLCIENASVTGSGKTLANFAAAILDGVQTCGIYPTNELLFDQYLSIRRSLASNIAVLDSQGLDDIMAKMIHMHSHAHALAWATESEVHTAVLTNPDVLYLAMYDLYGQMFSNFDMTYGKRVFQYMLNNYPVLAFDEFHLYSAKQIANVAFMMGTAKALAPNNPHIFIFSSATPQPQFKYYLQRLGINSIDVTDTPTHNGRVVCEPIEINLLPANLLRWEGGEAVRTILDEILSWADSSTLLARGVFIFDSVYEAKRIAEQLRQRYTKEDIGEVHGYMDEGARADALQRRLSVGTTTIDVGVDLTDRKSKEFLVCEARSAAQAIQRIGRLGRHGRESENIQIPNRIWLAVPEYVFHYIEQKQADGSTITRQALNDLLNSAYLGHEEFTAYTKKYSHLEAVAACERIQRQYFEDIGPEAREKLHRLIPTLYDKEPPSDQEQAEKSYDKHRKRQFAVWGKFGTEIKNSNSKAKRYYLSDLESFRGGLEADFTVAVYDDLDKVLGLKPIKTYNLPFILRRTQCEELSKRRFTELVQRHHPKEANEWLERLERQRNLLGYIHVHSLVEKANEVYFEISKPRELQFEQVVRLERLTLTANNVSLRTGEGSIQAQLSKRKLNCWISERNSFKLSQSLHLPPLFALYPLHAINPGGKHTQWSIAFGLDAFLLESIMRRTRRMGIRSDNTAIIL